MPLDTNPRWQDGDAFYAALAKAHEGLTPAQSERLHVRLLILLANHIADPQILQAAIEHAREGVAS